MDGYPEREGVTVCVTDGTTVTIEEEQGAVSLAHKDGEPAEEFIRRMQEQEKNRT